MAIESIIVGTTPNDGTGDSLRVGAIKINSNFTELAISASNNTLPSGVVSGSDQISGSFVNTAGDTMGDLIISGGLEVSGSTTMTGSLNIDGGISNADYIIFDTTPENLPTTRGTVSWNEADWTLDLIQNGTTLQLGQEIQYNVTNNSGQSIPNGSTVMINGSSGASGNILAELMDGSVNDNGNLFLGIATEPIPNGANGKVTSFGKVRGIKTDYTGTGDWGTTWNLGDTLYINPSVIGGITNVEPVFPAIAIPVGFVLNQKSNGTIHVRVSNINKHDFIQVNENSIVLGNLTMSGSLIIETTPPTSSSESGILGEIRTDENYIYVCTATNTWKRSPLTAW